MASLNHFSDRPYIKVSSYILRSIHRRSKLETKGLTTVRHPCGVLSHVYVCMLNVAIWISLKDADGHCRCLQYKQTRLFSYGHEVFSLLGEYCLVMYMLVHEVLSSVWISESVF